MCRSGTSLDPNLDEPSIDSASCRSSRLRRLRPLRPGTDELGLDLKLDLVARHRDHSRQAIPVETEVLAVELAGGRDADYLAALVEGMVEFTLKGDL
jgi:hypothetical protein